MIFRLSHIFFTKLILNSLDSFSYVCLYDALRIILAKKSVTKNNINCQYIFKLQLTDDSRVNIGNRIKIVCLFKNF